MESVTRYTPLARDDEEVRLLAVYEAAQIREHAAAGRLLYPHDSLPRSAYLKLVNDLQIVRKDCNEKMLAVHVHHNKIVN
jgi:hypothetical protein